MKNKADKIFSTVRKNGGTAAICSFSEEENKEVSVRDGEVETSHKDDSHSLTLRVWFGKRVATVSGNPRSENDHERLAERASAMARANPEDPFALLSPKELWLENIPGTVSSLDLADTYAPSLADLAGMALTLEKAGLSVPGVSHSGGVGVESTKSNFALFTTEGFEGAYSETSYSVGASFIAGEGSAMSQWGEGEGVRFFSDFRPFEETGKVAGEMAVALLGATPIPSSRMPVVFDRHVSGSLLGNLKQAINGTLIHQKSSFLNRETLGSLIFPFGINIVSDPLIPKLSGSFPFDGEGIAGRKIDVVKWGVLQRFVTNLRSAAKLGISPTGSLGNVHMENGKVSREELIAGIDYGLLVMEFLGKGVNIATGDYSRGAVGFLIENGKITRPVNEVTIAGNLREMFAKIVPANDMILGRFNAPTLRIDGMTVAGKE
jgi:PmbA protein